MAGRTSPTLTAQRSGRCLTLPLLAIAIALAACGDDSAEPAGAETPPPIAIATATATPAATPTPSPTATPSPEPTPPPAARPARCRDEGAQAAALAELEAAITQVMAGYDGGWSVALIDSACDAELEVNADWIQYTASAGKIVPIVAALRAVEAGTLDFAAIEEPLLLVMRHSLDAEANQINDLVTPAQVAEVLELSGVSGRTDFAHSWRFAHMPAIDLARVWAALLDGDLLGEEWTEYLLDLASRAEIPPGLETFPVESGVAGYRLGQKAGYYVSDGVPYFLLGAGYLRPEAAEEDAGRADPGDRGVALVFMMRTMNPELLDPQRREVYPLLVDYVLYEAAGDAGAAAPASTLPGEGGAAHASR